MRIKKILLIGGFLILAGCGFGPSKNLKPQPFLPFIYETGSEIAASFNNFSAFDMSKPYWLPNPLLWYFNPQEEVHFIKRPYPPSEIDKDVLFYLTNKAQIALMRDFYFSQWGKVLYYSFDRIQWYATDGDPRETEGFIPDIRLKTTREENRVYFTFTWAIREGGRPKKASKDVNEGLRQRLVTTLQPNQVAYSTQKDDRPVDLNKFAFLAPKGTQVRFRWDVKSNFFSLSQPTTELTIFKSTRNLYFYRKNWMVALSFDGKDYGDTFFSYRFFFKQSVVTDENSFPTATQHLLIENKKLK